MIAERTIYHCREALGSLLITHSFHQMMGYHQVREIVAASARWVPKVLAGVGVAAGEVDGIVLVLSSGC